MTGLQEDAMDAESADPMDLTFPCCRHETQMANAGKQQGEDATNVCAAMASIMSGLSVRVHVAGAVPRGCASAFGTIEKKLVHGQVARLRKEDQQLMEDVCTDACGCGCLCSIGTAGCRCGSPSPCRRRLLHQITGNSHDVYQTTPPVRLQYDIPFGYSDSGSSTSSGGVVSNVSTPRASTPSPLGIRTRSWSMAAPDAAWDSAASIGRTVSSSF